MDAQTTSQDLTARVTALLEQHDPRSTDAQQFLGARFDAGLAWVNFPEGHGGLGLPQSFQAQVNAELAGAGAAGPEAGRNGIGLGMAAPTIAAFGTEEQKRRFLRPLWTCEQIYCQLFSEPGAGSDLAAVATRAVRDGDDWIVNGQKVWTSGAQNAQLAILVARTDPAVPKHAGLTYFLCDMSDPGVDVRPLRQITGEAEFNEVFLTDVRIPDANRLGAEGEGWRVATTTLNNERIAIGSGAPREGGMIGKVAGTWRTQPELRTPAMHDELMRLWVASEVARLAGERLRQRLAAGQPGPEGSGMKLAFAQLAQTISGFEVELSGEAGLRYDDWAMRRPEKTDFTGREPGYRYLRAKGNSIEGGTSEILRNVIAERVLGLPPEHRVDKNVAWNRVDNGNADAAVREALLCAAVLLSSEQLGVAQWCLETTLAYVKDRKQFGRAIGSYQALKHRLADLWLECTSAAAAARYAADTYARGDADAQTAAAVAQAYCSDVAVHAAEECVQLHGGIGMTWEYPAHLYLKRAKSDQLAFGTAYAHRARLAELVDLPVSS